MDINKKLIEISGYLENSKNNLKANTYIHASLIKVINKHNDAIKLYNSEIDYSKLLLIFYRNMVYCSYNTHASRKNINLFRQINLIYSEVISVIRLEFYKLDKNIIEEDIIILDLDDRLRKKLYSAKCYLKHIVTTERFTFPIKQLVNLSSYELLSCPNIGNKTIDELTIELTKRKLSFGTRH